MREYKLQYDAGNDHWKVYIVNDSGDWVELFDLNDEGIQYTAWACRNRLPIQALEELLTMYKAVKAIDL